MIANQNDCEFIHDQGPRINVGQKMNKVHAIGAASLNLAEYASAAENKEIQIRLPLKIKNAKSTTKPVLRLHVCFQLQLISFFLVPILFRQCFL